MLYDNDGNDLDYVALESDFYNLVPTQELADTYHISEEQVLNEMNIHATVYTDGGEWNIYFGGDVGTRALSPLDTLFTVEGIESWKPLLTLRVSANNGLGYSYKSGGYVHKIVWSSGD